MGLSAAIPELLSLEQNRGARTVLRAGTAVAPLRAAETTGAGASSESSVLEGWAVLMSADSADGGDGFGSDKGVARGEEGGAETHFGSGGWLVCGRGWSGGRVGEI